MAGAVVVAALALVLQLAVLYAVYRQSKTLEVQMRVLVPKAEALMESAEKTIALSRQQITEVTTKASQVMDTTRTQLGKMDQSLSEITSRLKVQLERVEMVLDDSMGRVQETVASVHHGVMKPIREITGVAAGVRAAVSYLVKGGRPNVTQATHDEEMFI
ncbi:MAG: hypothetical protein ACK5AZ_09595 [Bryobacteraceae bacterium]